MLIENHEENKPHGRHWRRWECDGKEDPSEIEWDTVEEM